MASPPLPSAAPYAEFGPDGMVLRNPPRDFVVQGLLLVLLGPVLGSCALLVALLEDRVHPGLLGAGVALILVPYQIWRVAMRILACWRAYKGRAWVMPWLGFVSRRGLPEDEDG